jgi:hypothetical protein
MKEESSLVAKETKKQKADVVNEDVAVMDVLENVDAETSEDLSVTGFRVRLADSTLNIVDNIAKAGSLSRDDVITLAVEQLLLADDENLMSAIGTLLQQKMLAIHSAVRNQTPF